MWERYEVLSLLLSLLPIILAVSLVLYARWLWRMLKKDQNSLQLHHLHTGKQLDQRLIQLMQESQSPAELQILRENGLLDQQQSQPILEHDGGRGPGGGRFLLPRDSRTSNWMTARICWGLAAASVASSVLLYISGSADWIPLFGLGAIFFAIVAMQAAPHLMLHALNRVEVAPYPPAVGDVITVSIHNPGQVEPELVKTRLLLLEQSAGQRSLVEGWTQLVLWEQPFEDSESSPRIPILHRRSMQIPAHLPGTFLAPGYKLEWIIEVAPDAAESSARWYPLPVVQ